MNPMDTGLIDKGVDEDVEELAEPAPTPSGPLKMKVSCNFENRKLEQTLDFLNNQSDYSSIELFFELYNYKNVSIAKEKLAEYSISQGRVDYTIEVTGSEIEKEYLSFNSKTSKYKKSRKFELGRFDYKKYECTNNTLNMSQSAKLFQIKDFNGYTLRIVSRFK